MRRKVKLFISYKRGGDLTVKANSLHQILENRNFDVWMDPDLTGGKEWNKEIYTEIPGSDVLLLLLSEAASHSEWVRREVDVARGAQVYILPVLIQDPNEFETQKALDRFDLTRIQYVTCITYDQTEINRLVDTINKVKEYTRNQQRGFYASLIADTEKPRIPDEVPFADQDYAIYRLKRPGNAAPQIHVSAGDMTQMRDVDVLVNPENTYMQMARVFESSTLSSKLRWCGSKINGAGYITHDTVQQDLYEQIAGSSDYHIPVNVGFVVPTHAGHSESTLVEDNKARYIFHTAVVQVKPSADGEVEPANDQDIRTAVKNCLKLTEQINERKGVISPESTKNRDLEIESRYYYENITSIMFPLFTTGHGGQTDRIAKVAELVLREIVDYIKRVREGDYFTLEHIYICAYFRQDVQDVYRVFEEEPRIMCIQPPD